MPTRAVPLLTALLLWVALPAVAPAQETTTELSKQLWANLIFGRTKSDKLYLELDIEPKYQLSGSSQWWNVDVTPLVEYYPNRWIDLTGEITVGRTRQTSDLTTWELTARAGIRFNLIANLRDYRLDRVSDSFQPFEALLSRIGFATLVRLERRQFWYLGSDGEGDEGEESQSRASDTRLRIRAEFRAALNHASLNQDRTAYFSADWEYFGAGGKDVVERFASKFRLRAGFGYRHDKKWRGEILVISDSSRSSMEEDLLEDAVGIDLRIKILH